MPINVVQSPIYESISMLHPDGTLMCHCNQRKANWYVKRELAYWINETTFKLKFLPQGYGKSDMMYYTQKMENKCVVCGSEKELNKHHVVPYVFRRRLETKYKESNHHDILITCVDCHENYEEHANLLKKEIAKEYGLSLNESLTNNQKNARKILSARKIIEKIENNELFDEKGNLVSIPEDRLKNLKNKAEEEIVIEESLNSPTWADKVMEHMNTEEKLFSFVKKWRKHFIEKAKPKYLPNHWTVDHPLEIANTIKKKINASI